MYPTKEEILRKNPEINPDIIETTKKWKKEFFKEWKIRSKFNQIIMIEALLIGILKASGDKIKLKSLKIDLGKEYMYNIRTKTIYLEGHNPSIISALHELGHHLYGKSELDACRFSVWLFKEVFPNTYKNLKWRGHRLTK